MGREIQILTERRNPEAMRRIGEFYERSIGVPKDNQKALECYERARKASEKTP
jgi:TPR repeat protein